MTTLEGFEPIAEVTPDARGRITFGKHLVGHSEERFAVAKNSDGQILLTPVTSIPKRELLIWEDRELRESLLRGMADAEAGKVRPRDDFLDGYCEDDEA